MEATSTCAQSAKWSAGYTIWRHLTSSALKNRAECTNKDASAEDADAPNIRDRVISIRRVARKEASIFARGFGRGCARASW